jgi:Fe-S cluster assembly iron-binding protein IscA
MQPLKEEDEDERLFVEREGEQRPKRRTKFTKAEVLQDMKSKNKGLEVLIDRLGLKINL